MNNALKKLNFLFSYLYSSIILSNAQTIELISTSNSTDSSYYSICKISDNEFWIGGENGILKTIDSSKNIKTIKYSNSSKSIYKLINYNENVYAIADSGTIYKFNSSNHLLVKVFTSIKYKNKCFYDFIINENGKLIICGGNNKIIKSKKVVPLGFIIELDTCLTSGIKLLWKSKLHFVWSLAQNDKYIYASAYNGFKSLLLSCKKEKYHFEKKTKYKYLVQKIYIQADTMWLCGSNNSNISKNGVIIKTFNNIKITNFFLKAGCIWTMHNASKIKFASCNNGDIIYYHNNEWKPLIGNYKKMMYATYALNEHFALLAGSSKTILLLNLGK